MAKSTSSPQENESYVPRLDDLEHFYRASRSVLTPEATLLYSHLLLLMKDGRPFIIAPIDQLTAYMGFSKRRLDAALEQLDRCAIVTSFRYSGDYEIELVARDKWDFRGAEANKESPPQAAEYSKESVAFAGSDGVKG